MMKGYGLSRSPGAGTEAEDAYGCDISVGIGSVKQIREVSESYNEALHALIQTTNKVAHVDDTPARCIYEENYPIDIEKMLFELIEKGDVNGVSAEANRFFDWMEENYGRYINDIKLKSLEFVLWAEHIAYENGGMVYHFRDRQDYFPMIIELKNLEEVRAWFVDKMGNACRNVAVKKKNSLSVW